MKKDEEAKAKAEAEAKGEAEPEPTPEPEPKPEPTPKPEPKKGEGKEPSEDFKQRYETLKGMFDKTQQRLTELEKDKNDFGELRVEVQGIRRDFELITDVLGQLAENNEEVQQRVKQAQENRQKETTKAKAFSEIMAIAEKGGLKHDSPEMAPVRDAFLKGDYETAKTQTFLTVIGKVSEGKIVKEPETKEPEPKKEEKPKLPVNTSQGATPQDWREKSPKQKMMDGLQKRREES